MAYLPDRCEAQKEGYVTVIIQTSAQNYPSCSNDRGSPTESVLWDVMLGLPWSRTKLVPTSHVNRRVSRCELTKRFFLDDFLLAESAFHVSRAGRAPYEATSPSSASDAATSCFDRLLHESGGPPPEVAAVACCITAHPLRHTCFLCPIGSLLQRHSLREHRPAPSEGGHRVTPSDRAHLYVVNTSSFRETSIYDPFRT
ncbi:hypothetical protein EVAR_50803_1 [Eumeta japonica]|uniref:Uncharacterized protein n=1 Tax=Eumeta variegata TaxID=151549 RepID=A0A4C1XGU8_EUMVA|nr:hypothetical protein EVAR_50803_1 [Eumeta japonica]